MKPETDAATATITPATTMGVVVTYHPSDDLASNVATALVHADSIVVVDNTPGGNVPLPVSEAAALNGVAVVRLGSNRGVGAALNVGVQEARRRNVPWLLTLDQDTQLRPEWGDAVREGYSVGGEGTVVVGVGYQHPGLPPAPSAASGAIETSRVITSGSLWDVALLNKVGPFREDFVVDGIDNEICFRARVLGYRVVMSQRVAMEHELGILIETSWRGRPFFRATYSTTRYYYIFRNSVELVRLYGRREKEWVREDVLWLIYIVKSAVVGGDVRKLAAAARGIRDGLFRRFGAAPDSVSHE